MGVTVDTKELKAFRDKLNTLSKEQAPIFLEQAVKEMANRLLVNSSLLTIKNNNVGLKKMII